MENDNIQPENNIDKNLEETPIQEGLVQEEKPAENQGLTEFSEFSDELDAEYSAEIIEQKAQLDSEQLNQDIEGFASCFPKWDLHPPKRH